MRHHGIGTRAGDPHVLAGLHWRVGLAPFVDLTVAIDVEHPGRPALRLSGIAGLVPYRAVDPAGDLTGTGEPQRVIGVVAELRMVSAEACVDKAVLHRLGIEHRHLAPRAVEWEHLG